MKKLIAIFAVLALALVPVLAFSATDYESVCTPNGCSQGTLIRALYNLQVGLNDVITNVLAQDAVTELQTIAATVKTELTELKVDHDADNAGIIADLKTAVNLLRTYVSGDGVLANGTLLVTADATKFKTTTAAVVRVSKAVAVKVATDNLTFSAAYTVNNAGSGDKWGAFLVQVSNAGVLSTKTVGADQAYANEAAAIAALPAADASNVAIGYITLESNTDTKWTANTDDMTAASDCQAVNFVNTTAVAVPSAVSTSPAEALTSVNPAAVAEVVPTGAVVGATSYGTGTAADPRIQLKD